MKQIGKKHKPTPQDPRTKMFRNIFSGCFGLTNCLPQHRNQKPTKQHPPQHEVRKSMFSQKGQTTSQKTYMN